MRTNDSIPAKNASRPVPVACVSRVRAYRPPPFPAPIDLHLDGNEGPAPGAELLATLDRHGADLLRRYPDPAELEAGLARKFAARPSQVLITAGADDALNRICRTFCGPGRELVRTEPTFEMIERYAELTGARILPVPWREGALPVREMIKKAGSSTSVIAVVSPNNPTGAVARLEDLVSLSRAIPQAVLLVDLAYVEYADRDPTAGILSLPNAVVVRTFSKAWGLAGLRVGYAIGPEDIIEPLRCAGNPYAVSRPSITLATARMEGGRAQVDSHVERVRSERKKLGDMLEFLGARVCPSQGNFVLGKFRDAEWVRSGLASLGIAVRVFPETPALAGCLRISCPGDPDSFSRLLRGIEATMKPQAILFDMDGVLADVSGSYRQTIQKTAESFGVSLGSEIVSAVKFEPGSNNDWETTHRLLDRHGIRVPLPEVIARFESIYQGCRNQPGLRELETLVPPRELLCRLAARLPLAIVTGRPRSDAMRFLGKMGIGDLFRSVVCMEDAPAKPDPGPVLLAMERLGVRRAWMVGDTPDDLSAARLAGVVSVGVTSPGDGSASNRDLLRRAGAARVLGKLEDLEELIP